jgi:hypothetical protein
MSACRHAHQAAGTGFLARRVLAVFELAGLRLGSVDLACALVDGAADFDFDLAGDVPVDLFDLVGFGLTLSACLIGAVA